tara:strand:+ start:758 stop:1744 length:987 start_codon:yes stop_codon:yes gene_type:complete
MRICFLDKTEFSYSFNDKYKNKLRGAETILINLSYELSKLGNEITVFNSCDNEYKEKNYSWLNIERTHNNFYEFDIAISNNDTRLLNKIKSNKKFVISHSIQSIEKFIRKKQLFSYLKNKPKFLLLGNYHKKQMTKLVSLYGTKVIDYGIDDIFIKANINENINNNSAMFISRNDRNLNLLINIWKNKIFPKNKNAKLHITPVNNLSLNSYNIINREFVDQQNLVNDLMKTRMVLLPGHQAELYCLAASEATELCIPIVTMGIGSLKERVNHGVNGFIANDHDEFANYTIELFKNNKLLIELKNKMLEMRGRKTWNSAAHKFLKILNE